MRKVIILILGFAMIWASCQMDNPNVDVETGKDELKSLELDHDLDEMELAYKDILYVPIYSDIYIDAQNQNNLLAATLSIRNTSEQDSLFISRIEYYNTEGTLVKEYIENPISLTPMATVNYVIEKEDDTGGPGANFIIELEAKNRNIKPLVQAIMIGEKGNKGFAFTTNGHSILK